MRQKWQEVFRVQTLFKEELNMLFGAKNEWISCNYQTHKVLRILSRILTKCYRKYSKNNNYWSEWESKLEVRKFSFISPIIARIAFRNRNIVDSKANFVASKVKCPFIQFPNLMIFGILTFLLCESNSIFKTIKTRG